MTTAPGLQDVRAWIGTPATSISDVQLQQVLDAELSLQAACCLIPVDAFPPELAQAIYRRCAREVGARNLPLGLTSDTAEYGPVRLPTFDAEIERLEAPRRIVAVA